MINNKIKYFFTRPAVIKVLLVLTLLITTSNSFRYVTHLFYFIPIFYFYLIAVTIYNKKLWQVALRNILIFFPFGLWVLIASLWSLNPQVSLTRGTFFALMSVAAACITVLSKKYFDNIFHVILTLNLLVVVSSFISLMTGKPVDAWTTGNAMGFAGFAAHQNTLGALILFTVPAVIERALSKFNVWRVKGSYFRSSVFYFLCLYFLLFASNLLLLFVSHSRASLLSFFIFLMIFTLLTFKKKLFILFTFILILMSLAAFINQRTHTAILDFVMKGEGQFGNNRYFLFEASYKGAKEGGLTGLGYGLSHPDIKIPAAGSHYENERYIREKGNSILAIVEETGIIGFGLFLIPFIVFFLKLVKNLKVICTSGEILESIPLNMSESDGIFSVTQSIKLSRELKMKSGQCRSESRENGFVYILIFSAVISYLIHSFFEAWWVGVTSPLLFIALLAIIYGINLPSPKMKTE